ncbi:MAG: hypothetical protein R3D00_02435 [Bacteroidia bacterium]
MKNIILLTLIFGSLNLTAQKKLGSFKKGEFRLTLGLPYLNHLLLKPNDTTMVNKVGFIGESAGLEYSYSDKKFLAFSFSFVGLADNPLPFPFDKEGDYITQYSSYFSITNNHQKNRITYGYGVNYSINTWAQGFRSLGDSVLSTRNQITNQAIGLTLNCYYRIGKSFNLGAIYRPTYFRQSKSLGSEYEHLISIELLWRIRLYKK